MAFSQQQNIRQEQLALLTDILNDGRKYSVSYKPDEKYLIEYHLQCLLTKYTSLSVKYEEYTYPDGRTIGMIKVAGTIPITYSQAQYNIPVAVWINECYPQKPPYVYVVPTSDMIIKENHHCVDSSGFVQSAYVRNWYHGRSDLVSLVEEMAATFGREPPLFAKVHLRPNQQFTSFGATSSARPTYPDQHPTVYPPKPQSNSYPSATPPSKPNTMTPGQPADLNELKRRHREAMIAALVPRSTKSISEAVESGIPKNSKAEADGNMLRQRAQQIEAGIAMLQREREAYERNVQVMSTMVEEIDNWMHAVAFTATSLKEGIDCEEVIVPQDPLAAQHLKAQSEDLAAEETLTSLDELFEKEINDLETYLKQMRKVCRKQYYARALTMKIGALHHRLQ